MQAARDRADGGGRASFGYFGPLAASNYTLLTTFKRDGSRVDTPVNAVVEGDIGYFRTWDTSGKVKRLRHTSRVELRPSTARGRPRGPSLEAEARQLDGDEIGRADKAYRARHPVLGVVLPRYYRVRGWRTLHYELRPPGGSAKTAPPGVS